MEALVSEWRDAQRCTEAHRKMFQVAAEREAEAFRKLKAVLHDLGFMLQPIRIRG